MKNATKPVTRIDMKIRIIAVIAAAFFWIAPNMRAEVPPQWQFVVDYAPLVLLAQDETYFPSSVEYVMENTRIEGGWGAVTKQRLPGPTDVLEYFHGVDPSKHPSDVPIYAFVFPEKGQPALEAVSHPETSRIRVIYYTFYPYNRGKHLKILEFDSVWGNHVTDIEKCYITFERKAPVSMYCAAHSNQEKTLPWGGVKKEGTHPIVYSAWGSHGLYFEPGEHVFYQALEGLVSFSDLTSAGTRWETWKNVDLVLPQDWTRVPRSPAPAGWENARYLISVDRWGNRTEGCVPGVSECRLNPGPTGFLGKGEVSGLLEDMAWTRPDGQWSVCRATEPSKRCPWPAGIWGIRDDANCLPGYQYSKNTGQCYLKAYSENTGHQCMKHCSGTGSCGYGWDEAHCHGSCFASCRCDCNVLGGLKIPADIAHNICGLDRHWYDYSELGRHTFSFNNGTRNGKKEAYACVVP